MGFEERIKGQLFVVGQVICQDAHGPCFFGRDGLANDRLLDVGVAGQRDLRGGKVLQHDVQQIGYTGKFSQKLTL